jgi:hypothetical protein
MIFTSIFSFEKIGSIKCKNSSLSNINFFKDTKNSYNKLKEKTTQLINSHQKNTQNITWFQYHDSYTEASVGWGEGDTITTAIELSNTELNQFRGNYITKIQASIGCDEFGPEPGVEYELWIEKNKPNNPTTIDFITTGVSSSEVWHIIDIENYKIPESGSLFIGINYNHQSGKWPGGLDNTTSYPIRGGLLWHETTGWTDIGTELVNGLWGMSIGIEEIKFKPYAIISGSYEGDIGEPIQFDSSASFDPDGYIEIFEWDFGDGTTSTLQNPIHYYLSRGKYNVSLTVQDDDGLIDSDSTLVLINSPPLVDFAWEPNIIYVNYTIIFNASESYDPDGFIVNYTWDFDDGTIDSGMIVNSPIIKVPGIIYDKSIWIITF